MLSDVGSVVIRELDLLNEITAEQSRLYGVKFKPEYAGVPHPGTFVLDEHGVVVDRWFEQSYRLRTTGNVLVERLTGRVDRSGAKTSDSASGEGVAVFGWMADLEYRPWTEMVLHLDLTMDNGLHVYGKPIPAGYQPLDISVTPLPGLWIGTLILPATRPLEMSGIDEEFHVYEGSVRIDLSLTVTENHGPLDIEVDISYQACDDAVCFIPETLRLRIPLVGADHDVSVPPLPEGKMGSDGS